MFLDYFFYLKEILPVSITEFLTLLEALNKGLIKNMVEFYSPFIDHLKDVALALY